MKLTFHICDRHAASFNYGIVPQNHDLELGPNIRSAIRTLKYGQAIQIRWPNSTDVVVYGRPGDIDEPQIVRRFRRRGIAAQIESTLAECRS